MREILFRGKRIDNGEWVYGHYGEYTNMRSETISAMSVPNKHSIYGNLCYDVDLSTVGQFTGLTDKNGKKIFIDDIVEAKRPPHFQRGVVTQLSDGLYVFKGKKYHDLIDFKLEDVNLERCLSVIGNVHDNPDLLEVGE